MWRVSFLKFERALSLVGSGFALTTNQAQHIHLFSFEYLCSLSSLWSNQANKPLYTTPSFDVACEMKLRTSHINVSFFFSCTTPKTKRTTLPFYLVIKLMHKSYLDHLMTSLPIVQCVSLIKTWQDKALPCPQNPAICVK